VSIETACVQVVWFKRDLRTRDHLPLLQAAQHGPVLALYIFEPNVMAAPDYAVQHARFAQECLEELHLELKALGIKLFVFHALAQAVFASLYQVIGAFDLRSHEETGNALTYARDRAIATWCKQRQITWTEVPSHGVVRRLKDRDQWARQWQRRMASPVLECVQIKGRKHKLALSHDTQVASLAGFLPCIADLPIDITQDKAQRMRGGRSQALSLLDSFLNHRALDYRRAMSSPISAEQACSRLSPYIALGAISVREIMQRVWSSRTAISKTDPAAEPPAHSQAMLAALKAFESRLHWRCHFVQKLESQTSIEFANQHSAYNQLRQEPLDAARFTAWATGNTGFPMIDACMKMLLATGWINFRMRAMLVSFSSYQLWQHWREPALHLARQFLDYEPGIHYSQCQMQSGTTGINIIRMYNPVKQARDQDPQGEFVRRWIPALAEVPNQWIFEPWTMPSITQQEANCVIGKDYPAPIIDLAQASRTARDAVWAVRDQKFFAQEANAIVQKLGSRSTRRTVHQKKQPNQLDLF
jgi:deoxyribodipyrimidine photo-lyase